jgi:hypothetical protein
VNHNTNPTEVGQANLIIGQPRISKTATIYIRLLLATVKLLESETSKFCKEILGESQEGICSGCLASDLVFQSLLVYILRVRPM